MQRIALSKMQQLHIFSKGLTLHIIGFFYRFFRILVQAPMSYKFFKNTLFLELKIETQKTFK